MCGVAGFVNRRGTPADREIVVRMTSTLTRRGPDGEGFYVEGSAALGHRRLSIIDLAGGAQPMPNEDASIWVSYNGEIYNEPELRRDLESKKHHYRSTSDTESLVHLYEELGPRFVDRLNGMFAFALWDRPRERLVLARDRMGQKPLYYLLTDRGAIVFASEPKALLQHPEVPRALDPAGLARYLFYEYIPAPGSIWRGVKKLPRGHVLIWENGEARIERYWNPVAVEIDRSIDFETCAERFWGDFRSAVARHRRSDVPLGVFLSGGIDSSCVAAALCELEPASGIHTFSIGFDDPSFDESSYAREVAEHLGTDHHERSFSVDTLRELLPEVVGWLDEPFGDASILPTHLLCRFARTEATVCLGGDGSDELLAGYPTFAAERAARLYRNIPAGARKLAATVVAGLPVNHSNMSFDFKVKQFLRGAAEPIALAHQRWLGSFDGREIADLLVERPAVDVEQEQIRIAQEFNTDLDPLTRSLALYQETYLAEDILTKVDRASMACGLESRAPFLDAELVDSILKLPSWYKYGRGRTKRLLKRAAKGRLPKRVIERSKKGFGIPVARWLRGPLRSLLDDLLGFERLDRQGIFRPAVVARIVAEHQSGARDHRKPLWTLLIFQLWYDHWLRGG